MVSTGSRFVDELWASWDPATELNEFETGDVKAAGLPVKKTDGNHYAEGYDEKNPQH